MGMPAVQLKEGHSAEEFRRAAARSRDANQARRLLALAAVREGQDREAAARIGGMERQTLRDWVHAYNDRGIAGLVNDPSPGRPPKLAPEQKLALKAIVEKGPDPERDRVVRWRRVDLKHIVEEQFGVELSEDTIGRILRELGFAHISVRPQHPEQKPEAIVAFKKTSRASSPRP
jgi:transposase